MDYLNFYLEIYMIKFYSLVNTGNNNDSNLNRQISHNLSNFVNHEEIIKLILLIKNIKFLENENSTRNLILKLVNFLKLYFSEVCIGGNSQEIITTLCECFESIRHINLLPSDLISEFYKFYIQILISSGKVQTAEIILKHL